MDVVGSFFLTAQLPPAKSKNPRKSYGFPQTVVACDRGTQVVCVSRFFMRHGNSYDLLFDALPVTPYDALGSQTDTWCTCRSRKASRVTTRKRAGQEGTGKGRSASCSSAGEACARGLRVAVVVAIGAVVAAAAAVPGFHGSRSYNAVGPRYCDVWRMSSCFLVRFFPVLSRWAGATAVASGFDIARPYIA